MAENPFSITKAEGFNHSYEHLALLMQFKLGVAGVLLSNSNVFIEGSRGSGKSMYLRLLSLPVKSQYETLASERKVDALPDHQPFVGVYVKLAPTIFGPHEYENQPRFRELFQQLFNTYAAEHVVGTIAECAQSKTLVASAVELGEFAKDVRNLLLPTSGDDIDIASLSRQLRAERRRLREALNVQPFSSDERAQPEILWEVAEAVTRLPGFGAQRVYLLVDEYDSLSDLQQRIINCYLRKRDFPLTFKIGCKKHSVVYEVLEGRPLNPSGDFDRVELDDDEFGLTGTFQSHLEKIANRRLQSIGVDADIRTLLGSDPAERQPGAVRRYAGFEIATMVSSGIVRTFLELCRDMYSRAEFQRGQPRPFSLSTQDDVIKEHAESRWNALARDRSARPDLQNLIGQIGALFREKSKAGSERQIIRLDIIDFDHASSFLRSLLQHALEFEGLIQPNRERLQKNRMAASRGYLLHRLLCVHFSLEPKSRWDLEISSEQLERLALGYGTVKDVLQQPTKTVPRPPDVGQGDLFAETKCPILNENCPAPGVESRLGFLSCRLPEGGHIRDAIRLIQSEFANAPAVDGNRWEIRTAENYPAVGDIACKVCGALAQSEFVLVELSGLSPSVAMELGLAIARRKPTFILFNTNEQPSVPEPFSSLEYLRYSITPDGVRKLVHEKLIPFLSGPAARGIIRLGPERPPPPDGVFVALPGDEYHQQTVLPELKQKIEEWGLGPVRTEHEGHALQDLQRAATALAQSRYCLIDTTLGSPTRALYLGFAQGYRKPFANLVDADLDPSTRVFTNARSKSELEYRDSANLISEVEAFFRQRGAL